MWLSAKAGFVKRVRLASCLVIAVTAAGSRHRHQIPSKQFDQYRNVKERRVTMSDLDVAWVMGTSVHSASFIVMFSVCAGALWWLSRVIASKLNRDCLDAPSALGFEDPNRVLNIPTPSIYSDPCKRLSVVIPAYNEECRLDGAVSEILEYLRLRRLADPSFSYEVIVVDDGSKDQTYTAAMAYVAKLGLDIVRVLRLPINKGKGAAVKAGTLVSRGELVLLADADGATQFSELDKLMARMQEVTKERNGHPRSIFSSVADQHGFVAGSRAHLESTEKVTKRSLLRNLLMHGFHLAVLMVVGRSLRDTQCGFKLFTRRSAKLLFRNLRLQRWCFDVELVYLANYFHIPIVEESVQWQEMPGSKITPLSAVSMALELMVMKIAYMAHWWVPYGEGVAIGM